jgi:hypothetical protein
MEPVVIKGITSVIGMLVGAFCMWLGYKLYDKGVLEKGRIAASGQGFKVDLKDYGPGVAFAAFGAIIIAICATRSLTHTTTTTYTSVVAPPPAAKSPNAAADSAEADLATATATATVPARTEVTVDAAKAAGKEPKTPVR